MSKKETKSNLPTTLTEDQILNGRAAAEENFEQRMAFETYYKMGQSRSTARVGKEVGRHPSTILEWSAKFRWVDRVKERERAASEFLMMQQSAEAEAETKKRHLTLIDGTIGQWSKRLLDEKITLNSVEDLERLINLRWKIAQLPDRTVNPNAPASNSATIDLRLRNMDRSQLQEFLYTTLRAMQRVMSKPKLGETLTTDDSTRMNLDIKIEQTQENTQKIDDVGAIEVPHFEVDPNDPLDIE